MDARRPESPRPRNEPEDRKRRPYAPPRVRSQPVTERFALASQCTFDQDNCDPAL